MIGELIERISEVVFVIFLFVILPTVMLAL